MAGPSSLFVLFSPCIPAEEEPIITKTSICHPLIKINNSYCDRYGVKLDKYVNVSVGEQQYWGDSLWEAQQQFIKVPFEGQGLQDMPQTCIDQARFIGCHYTFPDCDRTTGVLKTRKICKETCLSFNNECSKYTKVWKDFYLSANPDKAALFACLEQPTRNAGETPECIAHPRNESLPKDGMLSS